MLVDAPCSGTGAWRRKPEGKWRLTPEELAGYPPLQDAILDAASARVKPGGRLVYATCSLLARENEDRAAAFAARHPDWRPDGAAPPQPARRRRRLLRRPLPRRAAPLSGRPGVYGPVHITYG